MIFLLVLLSWFCKFWLFLVVFWSFSFNLEILCCVEIRLLLVCFKLFELFLWMVFILFSWILIECSLCWRLFFFLWSVFFLFFSLLVFNFSDLIFVWSFFLLEYLECFCCLSLDFNWLSFFRSVLIFLFLFCSLCFNDFIVLFMFMIGLELFNDCFFFNYFLFENFIFGLNFGYLLWNFFWSLVIFVMCVC